MIVDKKNKAVISGNEASTTASPASTDDTVSVPEQVEANGPSDIIHAFIEMLKEVTWEYGVPGSPKVFKTVQYSDGQYERVVNGHNSENMEEGIAFPAAFVHFIDVNWLTSAQRFNDGRAELRIRFVLNRLDTHNPEHDTDVYYVAQRIHQTITEMKGNYECLTKRCNLTYVDPMESFNYSLQPCWMTYEIWFTTINIWVTRNKTLRKIVCPPFTNHSDQDQSDPDTNIHGHTDASHPTTYNEASKYELPDETT